MLNLSKKSTTKLPSVARLDSKQSDNNSPPQVKKSKVIDQQDSRKPVNLNNLDLEVKLERHHNLGIGMQSSYQRKSDRQT